MLAMTLFLALQLALSGRAICNNYEDLFHELENLPAPYVRTDPGIAFEKDEEEIPVVLSNMRVLALVRDSESGRWGKLVIHDDPDNLLHAMIVFDNELKKPKTLELLSSQGLRIMPGEERRFARLLTTWHVPQRATIVGRQGWHPGSFSFITPAEVIRRSDADADAEPIGYAPRVNGESSAMATKGSLEEWISNIAKPCRGDAMQVFMLATGLAPVLLQLLGMETGGFHFYGRTSTGKTTKLQIFASVAGNGGDPNGGGDSAVCRWNSTHGGLEALASYYNDIGLPIDEVGASAAKDMGVLLYNLASGQGKTALNSRREMRNKRSWRTLICSTGEVSFQSHLQSKDGEVMGGQLVRVADICLDLYEAPLSGQKAAKQAQILKHNAGLYYGTAMKAFIGKLISTTDEDGKLASFEEVSEWLKGELDTYEEQLQLPGLLPEQARVIRRFALVLLAASLAVEYGILPYTEDEVVEAVEVARDLWLRSALLNDQGLQGIHNVAAYIEEQPENCICYTNPKTGKQLVLIPITKFDDACGEVPRDKVKEKLKELSLLHRHANGSHRSDQARFQINGKPGRYYAIHPRIREFHKGSAGSSEE